MIDVTTEESRYDRQELITWWDQALLSRAKVLVVGAGALGNELVKNLTLLGVGHIHVIDMDRIEHSNLARGVFFREANEGCPKAEVLAAAAGEMNPEVEITCQVDSVMSLGLGFVAEFDLLIAGLDNREARVWLNQAARKLNLPWIDGAIEGLRGTARVFLEDGPCYECTLGERDREILAQRKSCALLTVEQVLSGRTPTTATTASVIAGIQAQEAAKILQRQRDLLALRSQGLTFLGETLETFVVNYTEDPWCLAHDRYETLVNFPSGRRGTLAELFQYGRQLLDGGDLIAEFEDDIVLSGRCLSCGTSAAIGRIAHRVRPDEATCKSCADIYQLDVARSFEEGDPLSETSFEDLAIPDADVVTLRTPGEARIHMVLGEVLA